MTSYGEDDHTTLHEDFATSTSPRGQINLDSSLDFAPQVMQEQATPSSFFKDDDYEDGKESISPIYDVLYDDDGNCIAFAQPYFVGGCCSTSQSSPLSQDCDRESCKCEYYEEAEDDYPSSWEDGEDVYFENSTHVEKCQKIYYEDSSTVDCSKETVYQEKLPSRSNLLHSANAWSDVGVSFHSSFDCFRQRDRFRPTKRSTKSFVDKNGEAAKFASDSNIQDALVMMEPGLRKIRKDSFATSTTATTNSSVEQNYYESQHQMIEPVYESSNHVDESGFFSYPWQEQPSKHVTKIPVNQFPGDDEQSDSSGVVTVNGHHFDNQVCNADSYRQLSEVGPLRRGFESDGNIFPTRSRTHQDSSDNMTHQGSVDSVTGQPDVSLTTVAFYAKTKNIICMTTLLQVFFKSFFLVHWFYYNCDKFLLAR